jgi:hypothetical protein
MKFNWTLFWTAVGAIAAIIALVFGAKTYFAGPNVIVKGIVNEWFIPQPISMNVSIKTMYIGAPSPSATQDYLNNVQSYTVITFNNVGNDTAKEVRIDAQFDGLYSTDIGSSTLSSFDKRIDIGDIRPHESKTIWIWANAPTATVARGVLVNYLNGSADVDFGSHSFGLLGFFARNFAIWCLLFFVFLFLAVLLALELIKRYFRPNIIQALYGVKGKQIDVTHELRKKVEENSRLDVLVSNQIAGDPAPGAHKELRLTFKFAGKKYNRVFSEDTLVSIP